MKLSVLTENTASGYYTAEHGLSYFIEYAKKITGLKKIKAVIGGFHLIENNNQTKKQLYFLNYYNFNILH